jgi:lipopolysaccharide/colanic/teichoic acid biosynthesis glycosyltransferase
MSPVNEQMTMRGEAITPSFASPVTDSRFREPKRKNRVGNLQRFYQFPAQGASEAAEVRPRRALIAGDVNRAYALAKKLKQHFPERYSVVGFVSPDPNAVSPNGIPVLGQLNNIADLAQNYDVDEVLIADFLVPEFNETKGEIAVQTEILHEPLRLAEATKTTWYRPLKRGLDIAFSSTALVVGAPLLALAALAVKLTSRGPVIFGQERVGLNGKSFTIYKFRTMRVDAEAQTGPVLAQHHDLRCTPIGGLLRATKIDELPQLFNVLRGDMSIVGPRPERPCFVDTYRDYVPDYARRHEVLPGLTGLAQTSGDHLIHVNVKLHYDLMYVYNCSPWLDAKLLLRTPVTILKAMLTSGEEC